jgi:competence protein ComEA
VPDLPPRQLATCAAALVAVLVLGGWYLSRDGGGADAAPPPAAIEVRGDGAGSEEGGPSVIVHVAGAVREPGVYRMRPDARVDDAVGRAGGATAKADLSQVNLAAKVEDGRQVLVPKRVPAAPASAPATGGAGSGVPGTSPGVPLNLNTATLEQLDQLQGIGPATAQQIISYREEHGGFRSVDVRRRTMPTVLGRSGPLSADPLAVPRSRGPGAPRSPQNGPWCAR